MGAEGSSPAALLESLTDEHMGVVNVQEAQALQYLNLLKAMKATKAEVRHLEVCIIEFLMKDVISETTSPAI